MTPSTSQRNWSSGRRKVEPGEHTVTKEEWLAGKHEPAPLPPKSTSAPPKPVDPEPESSDLDPCPGCCRRVLGPHTRTGLCNSCMALRAKWLRRLAST